MNLRRRQDHAELRAARDYPCDCRVAHRGLERSCIVDIDAILEEEPFEALWLEAGYDSHVVWSFVAEGVHRASRDVHVVARLERGPRVATHDAQPTASHVEALVGVLVVVWGWPWHTCRCHHFDGGDSAAHGQQ